MPRRSSPPITEQESTPSAQVRALVPKRYHWILGSISVVAATVTFTAKPIADAVESLSKQPLVALALVLVVLVVIVIVGVAVALSVMWRTTVALRLRVETLLGEDRHDSRAMLALVKESLERNTLALSRLADKIDPFQDLPQTGATRGALDPKPVDEVSPFPANSDSRYAETDLMYGKR